MCDEVEKKKYVTQVHGVGPAPCLGGAFAGARQLSGMEALIGWIGAGAAGGPGQRNPTNRCSVAGSRHGVPGEVRGKFCRPNKRVVRVRW